MGGPAIEGTADPEADLIDDVQVDHGGADILVAEELLDGADVVAVAEHLSGEGVAEGVAGGGFGEAGLANSALYGALHCGGVKGGTPAAVGGRIARDFPGIEEELPAQVVPGSWVPLVEGVGQCGPPVPAASIGGVPLAPLVGEVFELLPEGAGEHDDPAFAAFAVTDGDAVEVEVEILESKRKGFADTEAGAVHERRTASLSAAHLL